MCFSGILQAFAAASAFSRSGIHVCELLESELRDGRGVTYEYSLCASTLHLICQLIGVISCVCWRNNAVEVVHCVGGCHGVDLGCISNHCSCPESPPDSRDLSVRTSLAPL